MNRLFQAARDYPGSRYSEGQRALNQCVISILYGTGLRRSEACSIRMGDIDLDEGVIKIIGKGSKPATVLLTCQVVEDIKTYLRYRPRTEDEHLLVSVNLHRPLTGDRIT